MAIIDTIDRDENLADEKDGMEREGGRFCCYGGDMGTYWMK